MLYSNNKLTDCSSFYDIDRDLIDYLSKNIAEIFVKKTNGLYTNILKVSIRSIGNIVENIFNKTIDKLDEMNLEKKKDEILNDLLSQFELWVDSAFKEYILM